MFYVAEDHSLMAVAIADGAVLKAGKPAALFRPVILGEALTYRTHYAVSADGQRFLMDVLQSPALDPISILLNWSNGRR